MFARKPEAWLGYLSVIGFAVADSALGVDSSGSEFKSEGALSSPSLKASCCP